MSVPVLTQWVANALVVLLFPFAYHQIGKVVTFGFLAAMALAQAITTWFFVPETKNKPLEEIDLIGCADMRVDPAHLLGLKPGEALVLRNIGGRITPVLLQELGMLGRVGQVMGKVAGGGGEFHLVVLQHTDCGITRLAGDPAMLAHYFQIEEGKVEVKAVTDPRAAVAHDVALLKTIPALPDKWLVSGLVYDVATGLVEVVVPPAQIRTA